MAKETDSVFYWGAGVSVPFSPIAGSCASISATA